MNAKKGDVLLMVGTRKGAFLMSSDASRKSWSFSGPHFAGSDVFHLAYDRRDGTLFAAVNNIIFGAEVQRSTDLGLTWNGATRGLGFDADVGWHLCGWSLRHGRRRRPLGNAEQGRAG